MRGQFYESSDQMPFTYFNEFARMMSASYESWFNEAAEGRTPLDQSNMPLEYRDLMTFMWQAHRLVMTSGFRSGTRLTELYVNYMLTISNGLASMSTDPSRRAETQRTLIDHTRTYLRELTNISGRESHWLEVEIEKLLTELWPEATTSSQGPHQRRANVKP